VPAFVAVFSVAAAGEGGHAPLKRGLHGLAIGLQVGLVLERRRRLLRCERIERFARKI
jgi:hypothetical protein